MKDHVRHSRMDRLDVLRGIAVAGVVLVHSGSIFTSGGGQNSENSSVNAILTIFSAGRFGVEVFFLLSGFLIASIYSGSGFSLKKFALARFFRIWPLWAIFSVIWFFLLWWSASEQSSVSLISVLVLSLGFLLWISPEYFDSFIGGAWSIQIEVFAYGLFALLHRFRFEALVGIAIVINVIGVISVIGDLESPGFLSSVRRLSFQTGFNFFLLGWLAAVASKKFSDVQKGLKWLKEGVRPVLLALWIASFLFTPAIYGNPIEAVGFVSLAVILAFVVQGTSKRVLEWLGIHSYFIFFAHFVALWALDFFLPSDLFSSLSGFGAVFVTFFSWLGLLIALSPLAWLSMTFIERPLIGIGKELASRDERSQT